MRSWHRWATADADLMMVNMTATSSGCRYDFSGLDSAQVPDLIGSLGWNLNAPYLFESYGDSFSPKRELPPNLPGGAIGLHEPEKICVSVHETFSVINGSP